MSIRVGVNGFGRIGRNFFRALAGAGGSAGIEIVAVNDLTDTSTLAHLLKYDTVLGRLGKTVTSGEGSITVDGTKLKVLSERDPAALPWGDLGCDIVIESTGRFTEPPTPASQHLDGRRQEGHHLGAGQGRGPHDRDGRQRRRLRPGGAPRHVQRVLHDQLRGADGQGARRELRHRAGPDDHDPRLHQRPGHPRLPALRPAPGPRRRAEHHSDQTGAAKATALVLPQLKGKLDGISMRVPVARRLGHRPGGDAQGRGLDRRGQRRVQGRR